MYQLSLTHEERKAIDWVGHRNWNGHQLNLYLSHCDYVGEWDCDVEITFSIPEHIMWKIGRSWSLENCEIPYFSEELSSKFLHLFDSVV